MDNGAGMGNEVGTFRSAGAGLLKQERHKSNVPVEKLSEFLFTKETVNRQDRILNILTADKTFDKSQNYFDGRMERFKTALARQKRLSQLSKKHEWTSNEYQMASELISEPGPYGLHVSMFLVSCMALPNPSRSIYLIFVRLPYVNKVHLRNISCSSRKLKNTNMSDATLRQSWDTAPMFEDLRLQQPGIRVRAGETLTCKGIPD